MRVILTGCERSKVILPASSWLVNKYLPKHYEVCWLNYGDYDGELFRGTYVKLDENQKNGPHAWGRYNGEYLQGLDDMFVIFALDDYLLAGPMNDYNYGMLYLRMKEDESVAAARLCRSDIYGDYRMTAFGIMEIGPSNFYTVTTQYTIWRREFLVELLLNCGTPWDFELKGTQQFNQSGKKLIGYTEAIIPYYENSSLSSRWKGVNAEGVAVEDMRYMKECCLI